MIQRCLLRVQICRVGHSHDVSSSVPARTLRIPPRRGYGPSWQSGHTNVVLSRPLSGIRSSARGSPAVRPKAVSASATPSERDAAGYGLWRLHRHTSPHRPIVERHDRTGKGELSPNPRTAAAAAGRSASGRRQGPAPTLDRLPAQWYGNGHVAVVLHAYPSPTPLRRRGRCGRANREDGEALDGFQISRNLPNRVRKPCRSDRRGF